MKADPNASKKMTASAANSFGPGKDLVGMKCRGQEIISATRKYMTLKDGRVIPRKGNRVEYEFSEVKYHDDTETEGDRC